jgi:hypothetical protein
VSLSNDKSLDFNSGRAGFEPVAKTPIIATQDFFCFFNPCRKNVGIDEAAVSIQIR